MEVEACGECVNLSLGHSFFSFFVGRGNQGILFKSVTDLLGGGSLKREKLCIPALELPVGIATGRQTGEWDGFHVGTERLV